MTGEVKIFDPTDGMIEAGEEVIQQKHSYGMRASASEVWRAMEQVRLEAMKEDWEQLPNCHHGHVHKRPGDLLARCGGPRICPFCRTDLEALQRFRQVYAIFPGQTVPTPEKRK